MIHPTVVSLLKYTCLRTQVGYIGQKGIGFKSVFKVTRTPQIHSRNFHFQFCAPQAAQSQDLHSLSYIIPAPLPIPEGWDPRAGTRVVLPLDRGEIDMQQLRQNLFDVQASLLLFLNRLTRIEVLDSQSAGGGCTRKIRKRVLADGLVEVEEVRGELVSRTSWVLVDRVLEPAEHARRPGIDLTKLSIAIPLLSASSRGGPLPPRDVYAFLPLRSYGFKFVLQGDFQVPSSREAVDAASPFNMWLRENVPALFVDAFLKVIKMASEREGEQGARQILKGFGCQTSPSHGVTEDEDCDEDEEEGEEEAEDVNEGKQARDLIEIAFQMLPLPGQVSDFFENIPTSVLERLQEQQIIPCSQANNRNVHFVLPSLAVRRLKSNTYLECAEAYLNRLGMFFVHPSVRWPAGVEDGLRLRSLDANLWSSILVEASSVWTSGPHCSDGPGSSYQFVGEFVVHILSCIYKSRRHSAVLPKLRQLRLFPNLAGDLMSVEDGVVLQVVVDEMHALSKTKFRERTLSADFSAALLRDADASKMALLLGIQRVDNESFLEHHLLPALCDTCADPESAIAMLVFLKSRLVYMSEAAATRLLQQSTGKILLLNENGQLTLCGPGLHISRHYMPSAPDPTLFLPAHAVHDVWPTVSTRYLEESQDAEGWSRIWMCWHLSPFLSISRSPPHDCPELSFILVGREQPQASASKDDLLRFDALAQMLSASWSSYADMVRKCQQIGTDAGGDEEASGISFLTRLRASCWVPGSDGGLHQPAFLLPDACRTIFGDKEVFPAVSKPLSKEFMQDIGMCAPLSGERVLCRLRDFRKERTRVSVGLMRKLYLFLHRNLSASEKAQLSEEAVLFVPSRCEVVLGFRKGGSEVALALEKETEGQWCDASSCFLRDKSYLLDDIKADVTPGMQKIVEHAGYRCLAAYYCNVPGSSAADCADLCHFFRDIGVRDNPGKEVMRGYARLVPASLSLSHSVPLSLTHTLALVLSFFQPSLPMGVGMRVAACLLARTHIHDD